METYSISSEKLKQKVLQQWSVCRFQEEFILTGSWKEFLRGEAETVVNGGIRDVI